VNNKTISVIYRTISLVQECTCTNFVSYVAVSLKQTEIIITSVKRMQLIQGQNLFNVWKLEHATVLTQIKHNFLRKIFCPDF
jgi:hypothetical protein